MDIDWLIGARPTWSLFLSDHVGVKSHGSRSRSLVKLFRSRTEKFRLKYKFHLKLFKNISRFFCESIVKISWNIDELSHCKECEGTIDINPSIFPKDMAIVVKTPATWYKYTKTISIRRIQAGFVEIPNNNIGVF